MPDCNSRIRVKFVVGYGSSSWGVFREHRYETSQKSSQMFPNERLTPQTFKGTTFVGI